MSNLTYRQAQEGLQASLDGLPGHAPKRRLALFSGYPPDGANISGSEAVLLLWPDRSDARIASIFVRNCRGFLSSGQKRLYAITCT
jgi:hypothetical protein